MATAAAYFIGGVVDVDDGGTWITAQNASLNILGIPTVHPPTDIGGEGHMKSQFQSSEQLQIRLLPFLNTVGQFTLGGFDVVTLTIARPDNTLLPGGPHLATYDSNVDLWVFNIATASYQQGEWRVKAVTNAVNTTPQWKIFRWGDYVDDVTVTRKVLTGRWKVDALTKKLYLYDGNGPTTIAEFDLKDENGVATATRIFERYKTL